MSSKVTAKARFQAAMPWGKAPQAIHLLDLLRSYEDVGLSPDRYGSSDARTFKLSDLTMHEIKQTWERVGGGIFKCKRPWNVVISVFSYAKVKIRPVINNFSLWLDAAFLEDKQRCSRFLELCKDIYHWGQMDHGYVALSEEYERKNSFGPSRSVGGPNLSVSLPGMYWLNLFGPIYTNWFGRDRFVLLETHHKEELSDGGWLLITRPSMLEWDIPSVRAHERQIMALLGRDAFFEMEDPDEITRTPDFWGSTGG